MPEPSLLRLSRPRFWLYELGTYVLGAAAAGNVSRDPLALVLFAAFAAYFLFPANLLIYGVNDVYDYETDRTNPKKQGYEGLLEPRWHPYVLRRVLWWNLPFLALVPWLTFPASVALSVFALCATFYSMPPVRAKARPLADSLLSAGHYVATGVFGYLLVSGSSQPDWLMVAAAMAWCMAMHAYSAVPDIRADTDARLSTIATWLGATSTILLCSVLYVAAAAMAWPQLGPAALIVGGAYLAMMILSWNREGEALMRIYRFFPLINAAVGATITFLLLFQSFLSLP